MSRFNAYGGCFRALTVSPVVPAWPTFSRIQLFGSCLKCVVCGARISLGPERTHGGAVMGDGEYVGNASVHWSVDHADGRKVRVQQNHGRRPRNGDQFDVASDNKVFGRDA